MTTRSTTDIQAAARQVLSTHLLCGVDFVPTRAGLAVASGHQLPVGSSHADRHPLTDPSPAVTEASSRAVELKPEAVKAAAMRLPTRESIVKRASDPAVLREKQTRLDTLRQLHDRECPHCTTVTGHTRLVFGEGNPDADLMFIGEAPGLEEDKTGRPFVGRAGQKLDEIIRAMGFEREEVYIANVLKARPPENRTPTPLEAERCSPYLAQQVRIIRPRVIVGLGKPACQFLLGRTVAITRERGQWQEYVCVAESGSEGLTDAAEAGGSDAAAELRIAVMPTFHPAYILRNYTPEVRMAVWDDMQAVMRFLGAKR